MKPVSQTRFHAEGEPPGNCFAACIASLLEVSIEDVPWPGMNDRENWDGYWPVIAQWLWDRGWMYVEMAPPRTFSTEGHVESQPAGRAFWIATGQSPRGAFNHAVVVQGDYLAHDPHPSRLGLAEGPDGMWILKGAGYLVPVDPARFILQRSVAA